MKANEFYDKISSGYYGKVTHSTIKSELIYIPREKIEPVMIFKATLCFNDKRREGLQFAYGKGEVFDDDFVKLILSEEDSLAWYFSLEKALDELEECWLSGDITLMPWYET